MRYFHFFKLRRRSFPNKGCILFLSSNKSISIISIFAVLLISLNPLSVYAGACGLDSSNPNSVDRVSLAEKCIEELTSSDDINMTVEDSPQVVRDQLNKAVSLLATPEEQSKFFTNLLRTRNRFSELEAKLNVSYNDLYNVAHSFAQGYGVDVIKYPYYDAQSQLDQLVSDIKLGINVKENLLAMKEILPSTQWELRKKYVSHYSHMPLVGEQLYANGQLSSDDYIEVALSEKSLFLDSQGDLIMDSFWDLMYTLDKASFEAFLDEYHEKLNPEFLIEASCYVAKKFIAEKYSLKDNKEEIDKKISEYRSRNLNALLEKFPERVSKTAVDDYMLKSSKNSDNCISSQIFETFKELYNENDSSLSLIDNSKLQGGFIQSEEGLDANILLGKYLSSEYVLEFDSKNSQRLYNVRIAISQSPSQYCIETPNPTLNQNGKEPFSHTHVKEVVRLFDQKKIFHPKTSFNYDKGHLYHVYGEDKCMYVVEFCPIEKLKNKEGYTDEFLYKKYSAFPYYFRFKEDTHQLPLPLLYTSIIGQNSLVPKPLNQVSSEFINLYKVDSSFVDFIFPYLKPYDRLPRCKESK